MEDQTAPTADAIAQPAADLQQNAAPITTEPSPADDLQQNAAPADAPQAIVAQVEAQ